MRTELTAMAEQCKRAVESSARDRATGRWPRMLSTVACLCVLLIGCRGPSANPSLPKRMAAQSDELRLMSDHRLPKNHPLIAELEELQKEVATTLDLPQQTQQVVIYLFSDETRYAQYLQSAYPQLPPRRAYFVGTANELAVYAFWGEKIQEDLRHEYTHGILHASLKNVPLWLDEGLAEYFEVSEQPGWNGEYAAGIAKAVSEGWKPDIDRLESLDAVSQMQKWDYQESWAWVHFLLHASPETRTLLLDYLNELRENPTPEALSVRLRRSIPTIDQRFQSYAAVLGSPVSPVAGRPAELR